MFTGGTDTDHIVRKDMVKEINSKIINGKAQVPKGPGLGIELDDELVNSYIPAGMQVITVQ